MRIALFWKPRSLRSMSGRMLLKITRPAVVATQPAGPASTGGTYQYCTGLWNARRLTASPISSSAIEPTRGAFTSRASNSVGSLVRK